MYSLNTAYVSILLPQLMMLSLILTQFSKEQLMSHNQFASVETNYELRYSVSASAWKEMSHLFISNQVLSIFYERPGSWRPWVSTIWDRVRPHKHYIQIESRQKNWSQGGSWGTFWDDWGFRRGKLPSETTPQGAASGLTQQNEHFKILKGQTVKWLSSHHGPGNRIITTVKCFPHRIGRPSLFWIIEGLDM